ncbi:hypothetical protein CMK19_21725 [Candidatus Poribacteria bacterium]|nr:hypothetical protein [Candidatus Poribacteria bacterium]|tara:strand:- start:266 stop:652 length:387 start_codon:yes stop_codon:yes gene_type:complete
MQIIYAHATLALLAVPLGLFILLTKKGTRQHKMLGQIWVIFLILVSLTAIFIQAINPGQYSWVHLFIPFTLVSLIYSIWSIKKYKKTKIERYKYSHMYSMIGVYVGALLIAGAFTLMPGRFFHHILFG